MRRIFMILVGLALVAPLTLAQVPRTVTIQHATERTDGTPLTLAEIERVDVECLPVGGAPVTSLVIVPPNTANMTEAVFEPGVTYQCRARTVDTLGLISSWAESQVFTVGSPCQEAPSPETCAPPAAPQSVIVSLE